MHKSKPNRFSAISQKNCYRPKCISQNQTGFQQFHKKMQQANMQTQNQTGFQQFHEKIATGTCQKQTGFQQFHEKNATGQNA